MKAIASKKGRTIGGHLSPLCSDVVPLRQVFSVLMERVYTTGQIGFGTRKRAGRRASDQGRDYLAV